MADSRGIGGGVSSGETAFTSLLVRVILIGMIKVAALTSALLLAAVLAGCSDAPSDPPSRPLLIVGTHGTTPGKFHEPRAVAVDSKTGRFYVVDRSGRIQLFDADGKTLLEWRLPETQLGQPVGITIESDGNVLVNDSHYHRLLRYTPDGSQILARWGTEGTGPGQFTFGRDVVVDSQGFIYAGDYGGLNDRIEKFTRDGGFLLEWGGVGEEPGKFQRPQGMAIEKRGAQEFLLVADAANHRVQRFTLDGRFVASIGKLGRGPGELRFPYSVAVTNEGAILVCEWGNNRVQRFDAEGRSQGTWGVAGHAEGELQTPWDIAVGPEGRIYIADFGNHRVQVFRWPVAVAAAAAPAARSSEEGR